MNIMLSILGFNTRLQNTFGNMLYHISSAGIYGLVLHKFVACACRLH